MEKVITIDPVDKDMEVLVSAIAILNDYKKAGFKDRGAFIEVVMGEDTSFHNHKAMVKLNSFWAGRVKDQFLNEDLTRILEKLKVA